MSLDIIKTNWKDTPENHEMINKSFIDMVNVNHPLRILRDWVESNIWGFGERSFYWMWKLIIDEIPEKFTFMEIGVFRGQILALVEMLAEKSGRKVDLYGVSPLSSEGGYWESNYEEDVHKIFDTFGLIRPNLIKGLSTDKDIIDRCRIPLDILYIDGGHEKEIVKSDLINYTPFIKEGGYLVIDDCCNDLNLPKGYFKGHQQVTEAVNENLPKEFEFLFSVVHNKVWQKRSIGVMV